MGRRSKKAKGQRRVGRRGQNESLALVRARLIVTALQAAYVVVRLVRDLYS